MWLLSFWGGKGGGGGWRGTASGQILVMVVRPCCYCEYVVMTMPGTKYLQLYTKV